MALWSQSHFPGKLSGILYVYFEFLKADPDIRIWLQVFYLVKEPRQYQKIERNIS